jgi:hypothetical protein
VSTTTVDTNSANVFSRGALAAFADLLLELQQNFVEVSLTGLSAFVCWRRAQHSTRCDGASMMRVLAAWDVLDCDRKGEWCPEDPRSELAGDPMWSLVLVEADALP